MRKPVAIATGLALVFGLLIFVPIAAFLAITAGTAANSQCVDTAAMPVDAGGPVRVPLAGPWVTTSEWGMRRHPVRGDFSKHYGLDFAGGATAIVAPKAGVVTKTPTTPGEGNEIVLDHGAGVTTKYKHLAARAVEVGDQVWAGRRIGTMGNTGVWSTGAHLHFEVWRDGQDLNPRTWLNLTGKSGTGPPAAAQGDSDGPDSDDGVIAVDRSRTAPGGRVNAVTATPEAIGPYKGEQLVNAGHIIAAGRAMDLDARTITIGVMAAMGESSLVNIDRGDAVGPDSRGLFQQRSNGAWGTYRDRMDPRTATTNFFKALIKVPGYKNLEPTIAAHRTQRNADPNHYTRFWRDASNVVATLTDNPDLLADLEVGSAVQDCESEMIDAGLSGGGGTGQDIVEAARAHLGVPYSWGGGNTSGPTRGIRTSNRLNGTNTVGFDCSGLVLYAVHKATGITLPRTAGPQGLDKRGETIERDWAQMQAGDVIAFSSTGSRAPGAFEHIGIYAGAGQMIHAPRPGKDVELIDLKGNSYYESQTWSIKRFTD